MPLNRNDILRPIYSNKRRRSCDTFSRQCHNLLILLAGLAQCTPVPTSADPTPWSSSRCLPAPGAAAPPGRAKDAEAEEAAEAVGKIVHDFKISAAGTVVMETMGPGSEHEMINMYHLDGDDLVLTHYCAGGNQPTMRLDQRGKHGGESWSSCSPAAPTSIPAVDHHIHDATITLVGGDEIVSHLEILRRWRRDRYHDVHPRSATDELIPGATASCRARRLRKRPATALGVQQVAVAVADLARGDHGHRLASDLEAFVDASVATVAVCRRTRSSQWRSGPTAPDRRPHPRGQRPLASGTGRSARAGAVETRSTNRSTGKTRLAEDTIACKRAMTDGARCPPHRPG